MNLDDFGRVADAALQSIHSLLESWFSNGVIDGSEFCIGSRSGEAGKSMRVRLTGAKAGYWSDFSSDGDAGRDLISLYAYIEGLSQGKACAALARQLGIELTPTQGYNDHRDTTVPVPNIPQKSAPAQAAHGVQAKKPRTEWVPVLPVPTDAGPYPVAHVMRGRPDRFWEYRNGDGLLLGVIYRFTTSDGGKEVLPCTYARHPVTGKTEWRWISFRDPRPLYVRGPCHPELPVLVVEGEKCADAAHESIGHLYDVVSWPGGGKAVAKADWSELAGRRVVLWADADAKVHKENHPQAGEVKPEHEQPGMMTMIKLAGILADLSCVVEFVDIPVPGEKPDGWDVADLVADGATPDEVAAWVTRRREVSDEMAADLPLPASDTDIPGWVTDSSEAEAQGATNVVPLRLVEDTGSSAGKGKSTPGGASAGPRSRSAVRMKMIGTSGGGVKGCRENVFIAMKYDPLLIGLVALDLFALQQVKRRNPPWSSEPGEWTETDDFYLGLYLAEHYGLLLAAVGDIEKGVAQIAREHAFNPVVDMLEAAAEKWDGVPRVSDAFATYWGAPASEYMSLISLMFFVGLAKRAFQPGVKHDYAPVFEGRQGEGKSTALSILGGQWFADTPFRMGEKDGYLSIQGIFIYEIAELEQFNRSEVTAVKAFMSSQVDRYREPYGRRMKNQPRRTVFGATTNEGQYFKDTTGNRRFWPVETGTLNLDQLRLDREHLLGEAVHLMRAGVKWYPTRDQQSYLITPMQESRELPDEWSGRVWEYLEGLDADGKPILTIDKIERITAREILTRALHLEIHKIGQAKTETMRISNIMRKLGWTKDRESSGAREWFYKRPVDVVAPADEQGGKSESGGDFVIPF